METKSTLLTDIRRVTDGMRMPIAPEIMATVILEGGKFTPENIQKLCAYLEVLRIALTPEPQSVTLADKERITAEMARTFDPDDYPLY